MLLNDNDLFKMYSNASGYALYMSSCVAHPQWHVTEQVRAEVEAPGDAEAPGADDAAHPEARVTLLEQRRQNDLQ